MKSLKKTVIAVLVIGILSVAGMVMAQPMQGRGQHGPMGPFGGHHPMMGQPWNGDNLPPAPPAGPEGFCPCGRMGAMGPMRQQPAPFAPFPGQGFFGQGFGRGRGPAFGPEARGPRGGQFPRRGRFSPDMPQEVRAKAVEAAKLRIDLEDILSQKPLNREKALELNGKISGLEQEIRAWRFEQKLNRIEEFNKKLAEEAGKPEEK